MNFSLICEFHRWHISDEDLIEDQPTETSFSEDKLPTVLAVVGEEVIEALIDTGASVSIVSQALYDRLTEDIKRNTLPVSNTKVRGVIPDKSIRCRMQVSLSIGISTLVFGHIFIVVYGIV